MAQGVLELKESHSVDNQTDMAIQVPFDFALNEIKNIVKDKESDVLYINS